MQIDGNTLPSLNAFDAFKSTIERHAKETTRGALLSPKFSLTRERDAHFAWLDDMARLKQYEKNLGDGPDHYKQCAHLAYWLRRQTPVIEYEDWANIQDDPNDLYPDELEKREFIAKYGAELIAFDLGFQICSYYCMETIDAMQRDIPKLSLEYLTDVCHMLKFKHVSPHALYLIYKSLFV